ncbi:hypothetical protein KL938_000890 [Ogataea parapolymorpha]|nr:hypothetical protein KL938_000890 [Ogataea parapolymorpha]
MPLGTLYTLPSSPRSSFLISLIKYTGLDIEIKDRNAPEFEDQFPLKKCPAYLGDDGFHLTENLAIIKYITEISSKKYNWYGKDAKEEAKVWQWLSFFNTEFMPALCDWALPTVGILPYNAEQIQSGIERLEKLAGLIEKQLAKTKYLVGDEATLADLYASEFVKGAYSGLWDEFWVKEHPGIERWFDQLRTEPVVGESLKDITPAAKKKE